VLEYANTAGLPELSVIYHGGEPLLYGADRLVALTDRIRSSLSPSVTIDFSLQTNGVLLDQAAVRTLVKGQIGVSVSIDGPRKNHDKHRLTHSGASSFDATMTAIGLLNTEGKDIFRGCIAVIDPEFPPRDLLEFASQLELPRFDILLPDATNAQPPPGRSGNADYYKNWLLESFQLWLNEYSHVPLRWFDSVLGLHFGVPCGTDVMGFGNVSLLVVDTDGSIGDHDVFKIVAEGADSTGCHLESHSIAEAAHSETLKKHAQLLQFEGLSEECKICPAVSMCGGGAVMHRFERIRGFFAPTVYCKEMFSLLTESTKAVTQKLLDAESDNLTSRLIGKLSEHCQNWASNRQSQTKSSLEKWISKSSINPASFTNPDDNSLFAPFADTIVRCTDDSPEVAQFRVTISQAMELLGLHDANLPSLIRTLLTDIVVVRSKLPNEAGIFSFSDDSMPDVIYISTFVGDEALHPTDLADSIYHEFLHHVLYHFEQSHPLLFEREYPRIPAPWTAGLRPSIGFFHGTFIFAHLSRYWKSLSEKSDSPVIRAKASKNSDIFTEQAWFGIEALDRFALLTPTGKLVLSELRTLVQCFDPYPWHAMK
jgi:radical SAM protein with 4Fe4S-binding SPASM domain